MKVRSNTWDKVICQSVLVDNEYKLPESLDGMTVIDIGAHIGAFAVACHARGAKRVICYEPDEENFKLLTMNVAGLNGTVFELHNTAVTGLPTTNLKLRRLRDHDFGNGANTGHVDVFGFDAREDGITSVGINEILENVGEPVGMLKLDCEGSEWSIFEHGNFDTVASLIAELHAVVSGAHPLADGIRGVPLADLAQKAVRNLLEKGMASKIVHLSEGLGMLTAKRATKATAATYKVLWLGHADIPTGYAKVTENICTRLYEMGWDIRVYGEGAKGYPHKMPYRVYPAGQDAIVLKRVIDSLQPDLIVALDDHWNVAIYMQTLTDLGFDIPIVGYIAIDGENVRRDTASKLSALKHAVCFTEFGVNQLELGGYVGAVSVAGHAVDTELYTTYDKQDARSKVRIGIPSSVLRNAFIWGIVGMNQPRKRIDLSLAYFAAWWKAAGKPADAYVYVHSEISGAYDLDQLADYLGIKGRVLTTYGVLPESHMPAMYSILDVMISTSEGEGWGLCVSPETLIDTSTGIKSMRDVGVGDAVLTGDGVYHPVTRKTSRYSSTLAICPALGPPIIASPEHPFYVLDRKAEPQEFYKRRPVTPKWKRADEIKRGDFLAMRVPDWKKPLPEFVDMVEFLDGVEYDDTHVWYKMGYAGGNRNGMSLSNIQNRFGVSKRVAEDATKILRGTQRSVSPMAACAVVAKSIASEYTEPEHVKCNRFIPVTDEFLELCGWYVAEGSPRAGTGIDIDLHKDEFYVAQKLCATIESLFGLRAVSTTEGNKSNVRVASKAISDFMSRLFGSGAHNKQIPRWLLDCAPSLRPLWNAYFKGDGHIPYDSGSTVPKGTRTANTVSATLAWQIRMALSVVGIAVAVKPLKRKSPDSREVWHICIGGDEERLFSLWTGEQELLRGASQRQRARTVLKTQDYIFFPVRRTSPSSTEELVMDITVDSTHSFTGNGILLHNCNHEAAACGVPQIAVECGAMPSWAGDAFYWVKPSQYLFVPNKTNTRRWIASEKDFVAAMDAMYKDENLRKEYSQRGVELVKSLPSWDDIAAHFHDTLYKTVKRYRDARTVDVLSEFEF